jgi:hypothetical protein
LIRCSFTILRLMSSDRPIIVQRKVTAHNAIASGQSQR